MRAGEHWCSLARYPSGRWVARCFGCSWYAGSADLDYVQKAVSAHRRQARLTAAVPARIP